MACTFTQRETSRNAEILGWGLSWMHGLSETGGMADRLHIHLRAHRKLRNLTLEDVAAGVGVKFNTVSGWETGKRKLKMTDLERLAAFYGVHPATLLLAPEDGPKFEAMRRASQLAERMGPEAAEDWLRMGERIAPSPEEK